MFFINIGSKLTKKQHEVLYYILQGYDDIDISVILNRSISNIDKHKCNIYKALGCNKRELLIEKYHKELEHLIKKTGFKRSIK